MSTRTLKHFRFSIGLPELLRAVEYAKKRPRQAITMHVIDSGIGDSLEVSRDWNSDRENISEHSEW